MDSDEKYMRIAISEAEKAFDNDEVPVGAIIVNNNRIIARAHNQTELLNDVTAHAEIITITSASNFLNSKYLHDCTLYVSLEPCVMCAGALFWSQIDRIVFGAYDEKRGYLKYNKDILHPKTKVLGGVLSDESSLLLKSFFMNKR